MIFLTLMKILPGKASEAAGLLKRIKSVTPPPGIKVLDAYVLLGKYDGVVLFEAADPKVATNFVLKIASPAVFKTETLTAIRAEEL